MLNTYDFEYYIIDLGGVIINIDYHLTADAFNQMGVSDFDALFNQFKQTDLFDRYETGQISSQHFINQLLRALPKGTSPNKVVEAWNAMLLDIPVSRVQALRKMKDSGKKIFMLSNTNEIHYAQFLRIWNTEIDNKPDNYYDKIYLSHEIGHRKPEVATYQYVCNDIGIDPKQALFIDDSIQHIEGAKAFGLNVLHLTKDMEFSQLFS